MYIILTLTPIPIKIKRETMVIVGKDNPEKLATMVT
jgi:hypothetical protein